MTIHRFSAPAKVNLSLEVLGRRDDGYHLLRTVMTFFPLHDTLEIGLRDDGQLTLSCDPPVTGAPQENLVWRAAEALRQRLADRGTPLPGADLWLHKRIPAAAGLGGGSSDAATALLALNRLWGVGLGAGELAALGLSLGADLPIFLGGEAAMAQGVGERLTPLPHLPSLHLVLANPREPLSTALVFKEFSRHLTNRPEGFTLPAHEPAPPGVAAAHPGAADPAAWGGDPLPLLVNHLEPVSQALLPVIGEMAARLGTLGAQRTLMSGSGPTTFGVFSDAGSAARAAQRLARERPEWLVVAGRTFGVHPFAREWRSAVADATAEERIA